MNTSSWKTIGNFGLKLLGFSLLLFAVHFYLIFLFFAKTDFYFPLWSVYLFNFILVLGMFFCMQYKVDHGHKKTYPLFLTLTLVKMGLVLLFLLPLFIGKVGDPITEIMHFFAPYFCFLAFEVYSLQKFLTN